MHKKHWLFYLVVTVLIITAVVAYHTTTGNETEGLSQAEVIWNGMQELQLLCRVENNVERARLGWSDVREVSAGGSEYEHICPELFVSGERESDITTTASQDDMTCYLTFDDGPSRQTKKVLEILETYQIKATFFVVSGELTESGQEAIRLAAEQGHVIGMHADSHIYSTLYCSVESFLTDYSKVFEMIRTETGIVPEIYRFPGGSYNSVGRKRILEIIPEMERRGFTYFDWNVTAEDAVGYPTASSIKKNIFTNLEQVSQPVILMHDGEANELTASVLPEIIEELIRRGYSFDTLDHREQCKFQW